MSSGGLQMHWLSRAERALAAGHGPWVAQASSQPCCKKREGRVSHAQYTLFPKRQAMGLFWERTQLYSLEKIIME